MNKLTDTNSANPGYRLLISMYEEACQALATTINEHLFDGSRSFYWAADQVGGICDFDDADSLSPDDMVLILRHDMDYDQYAEWRNANLDHADRGYINLRSWLLGLRHDMLTPPDTNE